MRRKALRAGFVASVLALSLIGQSAGAVQLTDRRFRSDKRTAILDGTTGATALSIGVGSTKLTLAQSIGSTALESTRESFTVPVVPPDVAGDALVDCSSADALNVAGSSLCFSGTFLRSRGFSIDSSSAVRNLPLEELTKAGLVRLETQTDDGAVQAKKAVSTVSGLIIPNVSTAKAECDVNGQAEREVVTVPIPAPVSSVIAGHLAFARCAVSKQPMVRQESGEAILDVTLNQTLVRNVPQLNQAIDSIQQGLQPLPAQVRDPVNTALDQIQERVNAQPVVKVRVAPNSGELLGNATGLQASSIARGATIDLLPLQNLPIGQLDGIAQITVGEAQSTALVQDGKATATNAAALVRVKVLNILTPDPNDVLLDLPVAPETDLTILENTPLQSTIRVARTPDPTQACRSSSATGAFRVELVDCVAQSEAQALSISLFDPTLRNGSTNPLPNVSIELATSSAAVNGQFQRSNELPVLPVTGSGTMPVVVVGLALVGVAVLVRRWVLG